MPTHSRHSMVRFVLALLVAASGCLVLVRAQEPAWTPAYPLKLSSQRALAIAKAAEDRLPYVPGEVLVKFRRGTSVAGQQRALQAVRSQPAAGDLRWIGDVALWRDAREPNAAILAAQLAGQAEVEYAEPNRLHRIHTVPNDPGYARAQWNLDVIDMPRAWDINPGAKSDLIVAVVDTGTTTVTGSFVFPSWDGAQVRNLLVPFAMSPDLAASRLVKPYDAVFWDGPVLDMTGHGTHVASTIGEDTGNGLGQAGIAYNARIMPVKACLGFWEVQFILSANGFRGLVPLDAGGCPDDAIVESVRYAADNGAKVINLSLGGTETTASLTNAIKYAVGKGAVVTISAGNAFEDGNPAQFPAADARLIDGAIAVGAVGSTLDRSFYSSTGPYVEVAAPGGDSRVGGADGMIWQVSIASVDFDPATTLSPRFDRYYEVAQQGTSMAAPHVAGLAALLVSQGVTKPAAVEALIKKTSRDLGPTGRDDQYGFGLIQPRRALFGFGVAR